MLLFMVFFCLTTPVFDTKMFSNICMMYYISTMYSTQSYALYGV